MVSPFTVPALVCIVSQCKLCRVLSVLSRCKPHLTVLAVSVPILSRCEPRFTVLCCVSFVLVGTPICIVVTAVVMLSVPVCRVLAHGCCNDVVSACLLLCRRLERDDVVVLMFVISCVSR